MQSLMQRPESPEQPAILIPARRLQQRNQTPIESHPAVTTARQSTPPDESRD